MEREEPKTNEIYDRWEVVLLIDSLRERLAVKYGEMPDSTDLIRADRGR